MPHSLGISSTSTNTAIGHRIIYLYATHYGPLFRSWVDSLAPQQLRHSILSLLSTCISPIRHLSPGLLGLQLGPNLLAVVGFRVVPQLLETAFNWFIVPRWQSHGPDLGCSPDHHRRSQDRLRQLSKRYNWKIFVLWGRKYLSDIILACVSFHASAKITECITSNLIVGLLSTRSRWLHGLGILVGLAVQQGLSTMAEWIMIPAQMSHIKSLLLGQVPSSSSPSSNSTRISEYNLIHQLRQFTHIENFFDLVSKSAVSILAPVASISTITLLQDAETISNDLAFDAALSIESTKLQRRQEWFANFFEPQSESTRGITQLALQQGASLYTSPMMNYISAVGLFALQKSVSTALFLGKTRQMVKCAKQPIMELCHAHLVPLQDRRDPSIDQDSDEFAQVRQDEPPASPALTDSSEDTVRPGNTADEGEQQPNVQDGQGRIILRVRHEPENFTVAEQEQEEHVVQPQDGEINPWTTEEQRRPQGHPETTNVLTNTCPADATSRYSAHDLHVDVQLVLIKLGIEFIRLHCEMVMNAMLVGMSNYRL